MEHLVDTPCDVSDLDLVTAAREGDQIALSELLTRYRPSIQRQVQRFPVSPADQHDLVQDALLQVIRKISSFRGDAQFSTWLYRITANAALMKLRAIRRRRLASTDVHSDEVERAMARSDIVPGGDWSNRADHRFDTAQRHARLTHALASLPEGHRAVILDHYMEGLGLQDIAVRLRTTESAVRSRLHRARAALRRALEDGVSHEALPEDALELELERAAA